MGFKMVMVTSNNTILKYAESIRQEYNYDITFITSELEDCLEAVRGMFQKEKHFILASRGATASLLRKTFNRPVMEIQVTDYDIMRLIYPVKDRGKRLAIMGYKYVIRRTMKIAELLNIKIVPFEIESSDEIQPSLKKAREDGIEVVIGEGYVSECARDAGFETLHIDYGLETVQAVIEEGKKLYDELEKLSIIDERHSLILESMEEGVIAIDEKERISVFNLAAEKLYECSKEQMMGKPIREVIPSTRMPGVLKNGRATMGALLDTGKHVVATNIIPIIVEGEIKGAVSTFRDISEIQQLENKIRVEAVKKGLYAKKTFADYLYSDQGMGRIIEKTRKYAAADSTVLIFGESGTGKEIIAQAIHNESKRHKNPFVALNCAALPKQLMESELFGYVEGSFTGALKVGKKGLFEIAHTGTIFLDEISEMDMDVQARFLRVIQEKEVMRIGDDKVLPVDVRIIAATNRDLWQCVQEGTFRKDLFYRLNVLNVRIPPLRDRVEDIPVLAQHYLSKFEALYSSSVTPLSSSNMEVLKSSPWYGNVRELQNIIERYVITGELHMDASENGDSKALSPGLLEGSLSDMESRLIGYVFRQEGFSKSNTAKRLGITRMTLDKKLKNNTQVYKNYTF